MEAARAALRGLLGNIPVIQDARRLAARLTASDVDGGRLLVHRGSQGLACAGRSGCGREQAARGATVIDQTTTTFAEQCLLPVLGNFSARNRSLEVQVVVSNKPVDLESEGIDLAIRQGHGKYSQLEVALLFRGCYTGLQSIHREAAGASEAHPC